MYVETCMVHETCDFQWKEQKEREENVEPESNNVENDNKEEECNVMVMVEEIEGLIESVIQFGEYRRTQREESHNIARRFKHMLPLKEDFLHPVPRNRVVWLRNLRDALSLSKELLKLCSQGSKIHLINNKQTFFSFFMFLFLFLMK